jgi:hypothetical protein
MEGALQPSICQVLSLVRNHMGVNWTEVEGFFHYSISLKQGGSWRSLSPTTWLVATTVSISNCAHLMRLGFYESSATVQSTAMEHLTVWVASISFNKYNKGWATQEILQSIHKDTAWIQEWLQHFCWQNLFTKDPWAFVC